MKSGLSCLARANVAVWMTIGVIAIADAGFALIGPFELNARSFLLPAAATALLASGGWFYRSIRNEERLGAILSSTAHIIAFAAVAAPLSYVAATAGFALQDATLDAWDRSLGIDWTELLTFIASRPLLQNVLLVAYSSFALQTVTTVLVLGIAGQLTRLSTFIGAFVATTLVTIAVSAVYPAAGPWLFLNLQPENANGFLPTSSNSWPVFLGLRDGTLHTVYGLNSEGIITFPSLHAALGVLFPAALWRVSSMRWIALALNGLLLLSTPAYGSHYVVDVIAGIAVAAACWMAVARVIDAASRPQLEHIATIYDPPSIVPEALPAPVTVTPSREFESS
ncbi:MAG: phosphatase PAP2 family protein [Bradyrhizobium sp.]